MEDAVSDATTAPLAVARWAELGDAERTRLLRRGIAQIFDPELRESVGQIIEDVRDNGDAAVIRALKRFDHCDVAPDGLRVSDDEFERAGAAIGDGVKAAIRQGIANVRAFNEY